MRLFRVNPDGSFSLIRFVGHETPRYAILSHTWEVNDQEVTFRDVMDGLGKDKAGYNKIQFCAERAKLDGIQHFWVDSCCIDKSSSSELTEAINSMFRWYRNAVKCYVYLSDFPTADFDPQRFRQSRWFTRGWTLQELLAPQSVEFFSRDGRRLGNKQSLELQIHQATCIPIQALQQVGGLSQFSIEERMSWAAKRETTIEEDQAYCLLGIFGVYLPLIYGEGKEHALHRLQKEISTTHARDAPRDIDASVAKKTDACLSNLCATDQTRFLSQALIRSRGACAWIFGNQKFTLWRQNTKSSLLRITANAGCGKTTIAAHVCQMLSTDQTHEALVFEQEKLEPVVLYFFFRKSNDETVKTASAALRTIISQFVSQVPAILPILLKRHDLLSAKGDFEWSWENLTGLLGELLNQASLRSRVHIIFDALDECEAESRILIVDWMKDLVDADASSMSFRNSKTIIKLLVTGRPDGDMIDHLSGFPTLEITDSDTKDDIRALVQSRMEDFASQRRLKPDITQSIIRFLESNAHGMFLWVVLVMKELERRDERLNDETIVSKLSRTPLTLVDTYETILHKVPRARKQDMLRIIRWLLFASRSLTLVELETALCFETKASSWYDFAGDLKFLCGSLVRLDGPHGEVNFVHQTARGFLESYPRKLSPAAVGGIGLDANAANEHLAGVCAQYLLGEEISWEWEIHEGLFRSRKHSAYVEMTQDFLRRYPLLRYAIESWAFHARAIDTPSSATIVITRRLLSSQVRRDGIMTLTFFIYKQASRGIPIGQTPLHLAVYFNIPWLAQTYISDNRSSIHSASRMRDTPLIWASEMGSTECVIRLLDAGADPNAFETDGWSALHWAARNGHLNVATLLLEYGASLDQRDIRGHTPIDWAIDRGYWAVVALLKQSSYQREHGRSISDSELRQWMEKIMNMSTAWNTGRLWDLRP